MTVNVHVPVNENAIVFDHEKLDVYRAAIEFCARVEEIVGRLPRGRGYLADQLNRAALSVVLNIAEGAGKFSPDDKASFYVRSRGSAMESAAVLDVCSKLNLIEEAETVEAKKLLGRIVQMLSKLAKVSR